VGYIAQHHPNERCCCSKPFPLAGKKKVANMRPIRLLAALSFCILTITTLLFLLPAQQDQLAPAGPATKKKGKLRALFSFQTPLFPPSAIISLTDDNSTFFLARPAAFGPVLPSNGLSGQLWIGSGFGEDNLGRGGRAEGELGCSDVPGWDASSNKPGHIANGDPKMKYTAQTTKLDLAKKEKDKSKRADTKDNTLVDAEERSPASSDKSKAYDGTDDHLLKDSDARKAASLQGPSRHADIQSLQESAEIAGKVVLLSRGGCGFLEKVKWVQRRGGKALIVGDDVRGGPLVTMYARGDTTNVTVPALFTSYTTAHLLSSLIPYGGAFDATSVDGSKVVKIPTKFNQGKGENREKDDDKATFTTTAEASKPTVAVKSKIEKVLSEDSSDVSVTAHKGWIRSILTWIGLGGDQDPSDVSRRPPNSGRLDWVMVEDWDDDKSKKTVKTEAKDHKAASMNPTADNFVIGVHDWRDPDLLPNKKDQETSPVKPRKADKAKDKARAVPTKEAKLKGGSITPGSGEYEKPGSHIEASSDKNTAAHGPTEKQNLYPSESGDGWLSHLPWSHEKPEPEHHDVQCAGKKCTIVETASSGKSSEQVEAKDGQYHEGLWVTLTPTNMSSSPFFDTLLVLVVSPLATLTVVYALLLLRSRIRRRRWRAPKSVVERLPVRTYHTISSESSTTSIATPISSSPSTPLLSPGPRRVVSRSSSRSRPRSRTTSEVPETATSSSPFSEHHESLSAQEKREHGLAEWRRRYGGRQKECVVCLEEYVDGISRVMSLPCGHEFHAECM
jgi:hypothetical protein